MDLTISSTTAGSSSFLIFPEVDWGTFSEEHWWQLPGGKWKPKVEHRCTRPQVRPWRGQRCTREWQRTSLPCRKEQTTWMNRNMLAKKLCIFQGLLFMSFPRLFAFFEGIWLKYGVKTTFSSIQCSLVIRDVSIRSTVMERIYRELRGKPVPVFCDCFSKNFWDWDRPSHERNRIEKNDSSDVEKEMAQRDLSR